MDNTNSTVPVVKVEKEQLVGCKIQYSEKVIVSESGEVKETLDISKLDKKVYTIYIDKKD